MRILIIILIIINVILGNWIIKILTYGIYYIMQEKYQRIIIKYYLIKYLLIKWNIGANYLN